jgi:hypothetical protein
MDGKLAAYHSAHIGTSTAANKIKAKYINSYFGYQSSNTCSP